MNNFIYLLNLKISGIKNIQKPIRLDFYKKTIDKDFDSDKYRVKAIYGENGSGKSAIVTAVKIFRDIIINSNYLNESSNQTFLDEIINKKSREFHFECEYIINLEEVKIVYQYSFTLSKNENGTYGISSEKLMVKSGNYSNNNYKTVFETKDGELVKLTCLEEEKEFLIKKTFNLLSTKSMIPLYMSYQSEERFNAVIDDKTEDALPHIFMCVALIISLKIYLADEDQHERYLLKKKLQDSGIDKKVFWEKLISQEKGVDLFIGVSEKIVAKEEFERYEEKVKNLTEFIKIFKPELKKIDIDRKENGDVYYCELVLDYGDFLISKEFESTGIKKLIELYDCFALAGNGGIVFIDEMDSNLNDVYLCRLIEYFMYYGKGQLCFTTHNLDPMAVLKENKNSIDFLSSDNHLVPWVKNGNASPDNSYRNGMIEYSPFNVNAADFIGMFGE